MISRIRDEGWRAADAAAAADPPGRRAHGRLRRFRAGGERALQDRRSTPARFPHAVPAAIVAAIERDLAP